jgi:hypothetical protein
LKQNNHILFLILETQDMNNKILLAAGTVALSATIYTTAISAATITANASANVVQAISITEDNTGMDFGSISETGGGILTLNLDGSIAAGAGTDSIVGGGNVQGIYTITGADGLAYTLSFPASATVANGGNTMTVNNFNNDADGTALSTGEAFNLGADIAIGAGQVAGPYTGTYSITVEYN